MTHKHSLGIFPVKWLCFTLWRAECKQCGERKPLRWWKATALNDADAMEASDDDQ